MAEMRRKLGMNGPEISTMGLGCWAIGGPFEFDGRPAGWGEVDDEESVRAIRRALEIGVTFFDTADVYGCGRSERVLGRALKGRREEAVVATKFGLLFDEEARTGSGADVSPAYIRKACEASLRRLGTDYIDLYQLHAGVEDAAGAHRIIEVLEGLVTEGKIRAYGASVDTPALARTFAEGPHCIAIQHPGTTSTTRRWRFGRRSSRRSARPSPRVAGRWLREPYHGSGRRVPRPS
jgi:aryl-alcohol dehydrogenase-like predicted oxidoreductase